jgi:hypothetical protein
MKGNKHMKTIAKFIYGLVAVVSLAIGAAIVNAAQGDLVVSINGDGSNGAGLIYEYTPTGCKASLLLAWTGHAPLRRSTLPKMKQKI